MYPTYYQTVFFSLFYNSRTNSYWKKSKRNTSLVARSPDSSEYSRNFFYTWKGVDETDKKSHVTEERKRGESGLGDNNYDDYDDEVGT